MGMGYGANFADMISYEQLKELLPEEWETLEKTLKQEDKTLEDFACNYQCGTDGSDVPAGDEVGAAVLKLSKAFSQKYEGLDLLLYYHNQENDGDQYDDVDGAFFAIHGLYELTSAAKKLGKDKWQRCFYVHLG